MAAYIAELIKDKGLSPERIVKHLNRKKKYKGIIKSSRTIYSAIEKEYIPGVSQETLNPTVFKMHNDGCLQLPKWAREKYGYTDSDLFQLEATEEKIIFTKLSNHK